MKQFMVPILVICSAIFPIASAQTIAPATVPSATAKKSSPTFEVVSIHSSKRNAPRGFKSVQSAHAVSVVESNTDGAILRLLWIAAVAAAYAPSP